jgi:hypothetical protein
VQLQHLHLRPVLPVPDPKTVTRPDVPQFTRSQRAFNGEIVVECDHQIAGTQETGELIVLRGGIGTNGIEIITNRLLQIVQEVYGGLDNFESILADLMTRPPGSPAAARTDMYVSTLASYLQAVGADLEIRAVFPDGRAVKITQFSE